MTPDEIRILTEKLLERDRDTFMAAQPRELDSDPFLAAALAETFAAGFVFGAAAGLEISKEVHREAAIEMRRKNPNDRL